MVEPKHIIIYQTVEGKESFNLWLDSLKDKKTIARIEMRLTRVGEGNYGDYESVGNGVFELRFFFGAGYRVYFGEDEDNTVIILCGGDKSTQKKDIKQAHAFWQDYMENKQ